MAINLDHVTQQITVTDSGANASLTAQPKGTGSFNIASGSSGINISNGGTVTNLTVVNTGGSYTTLPTVTISAPTTAGGVQATANPRLFATAATVQTGGTGYTLNDVVTIVGGTPVAASATFTVTGVSGGAITSLAPLNYGTYTAVPTNPVSITGGTGSSATLNASYGVVSFAITNAGSGYVEPPTVTITGGGGGSAAAYASIGATPKIQTVFDSLDIYGPNNTAIMRFYGKNTSGYPTNGTTPALAVIPPTSNFGTTTIASSSQLYFVSGNTGTIVFQTAATSPTTTTNSGTSQFQVAHTGSAVNTVQVTGAATGSPPAITVQGSDTNVRMNISSKGTESVDILTNNTGTRAARFAHTASAVNYVQVTGAATSNNPVIAVSGSDNDISLNIQTRTGGAQYTRAQILNSGTGNFGISASGGIAFGAIPQANQVNGYTATGALTTKSPVFAVAGSDTNVSAVFQSKGTGAIDLAAGSSGVNLSNGGTVTAITRTAAGNANYTSIPSVVISAPTTAGGVQATATVSMGAAAATIGAGGTGYAVNDVLTLVGGTLATGFATGATFTVTAVSGGVVTAVSPINFNQYTTLPTNPVTTTGGTGTGCTLNVLYALGSVWNITNAGSGYVEQPTVTFSGGGGSGAAAYATVGSPTVLKTIGNYMAMFTPGGEAFRVADSGRTTVNFFQALGSSTGVSTALQVIGADTNVNGIITSKGTGYISFQTNAFSQEQLRVSHTASAVNYVQVTGAATGGSPVISVQGSDAGIALKLNAKGGSQVILSGNGVNTAFQTGHVTNAVNYFQATPAATGFGPVLSAQGSDTNIPAVVQPKGTGALQAQQTDSTATGGNARGANAVDWQTLRSTNTMVANGLASVLTGGQNNTASSYTAFVGAGANNSATGPNSAIVAGNASYAPGQWSFIGSGNGNTAGGFYNFIGGGQANGGTAQAAVTTQSATMNGTTAVTLAASNASIKVGQYISGTSIAANTYVAAVSGTSLTLSQAASGSSTSTLSFYTPHGVVVGGGNNTATGSYSFIGGGGDAGTAGNRNVASGDWSVVAGGQTNNSSGLYSVISGGSQNTSSGLGSVVVGGNSNTSSANYSFVAGLANFATGNLSAVLSGANGNARSLIGAMTIPASNNPTNGVAGSSQAIIMVLGRTTTDATPTVLCSNIAAAGSSNQVIMPNNSAYYFFGTIVAGVTGGGDSKGWRVEGLIKRGASAAATTLVGSTVTSSYADAGASTWTIALSADTTNGGLAVTFTGQAGTTIRCVAKIETTEMTY